MKINIQTALRQNFGKQMTPSGAAIYPTTNLTDTAKGDAAYYASHIVNESAHFFVDDKSIWQSVPIDYQAKAKKWGAGRNEIVIVMCAVNGIISDGTKAKAEELLADLQSI